MVNYNRSLEQTAISNASHTSLLSFNSSANKIANIQPLSPPLTCIPLTLLAYFTSYQAINILFIFHHNIDNSWVHTIYLQHFNS